MNETYLSNMQQLNSPDFLREHYRSEIEAYEVTRTKIKLRDYPDKEKDLAYAEKALRRLRKLMGGIEA